MGRTVIGTETRPLEQADPEWITQQINRRRHEGVAVCVRVQVNTPDLAISFATPACASTGVGGRAPTAREQGILDLWIKHGLNERGFSPGSVVAFVKQLMHVI
jgi:hypothetical protein